MLTEFTYASPGSRDELFELLSNHGAGAKLLAGGTDLLPDIRQGLVKPLIVVDIKKIKDYRVLSFDAENGLSIGAAVRCIDLLNSQPVLEKYPILATAAGQIGSPQIRNRATITGNICTASPSADMAPALLCLDAVVSIGSRNGSRRVPLQSFFTGVKKSQLKMGEVVERIIVPARMAGAFGNMEKLKRIRGHDLALASVALIKKGEIIRIAIGACAPTPVLLRELKGNMTVEEVQKEAKQIINPIDDVRASAEYRSHMVSVFISRLLDRI